MEFLTPFIFQNNHVENSADLAHYLPENRGIIPRTLKNGGTPHPPLWRSPYTRNSRALVEPSFCVDIIISTSLNLHHRRSQKFRTLATAVMYDLEGPPGGKDPSKTRTNRVSPALLHEGPSFRPWMAPPKPRMGPLRPGTGPLRYKMGS